MIAAALLRGGAWVAHHAGPMALAGGLVLVGYQHVEIGRLNAENAKLKVDYQNALENPKIITQLRDVPVDRPVPFKVTVPGETKVVTVTVTKTVLVPGQTRIVTVAPPVLCATVDECKRIFGASEQTITAQAHVRAGTIVPVLVNDVPTNLPLAADFPVHLTLVMDTRGVFSGVGEPDNVLQPDSVSTSTRVVIPVPPLKPKRWDATVAVGASTLFGGVTYVRGELDYHPFTGFLAPAYVGAGYRRFSGGPVASEGSVEIGATLSF